MINNTIKPSLVRNMTLRKDLFGKRGGVGINLANPFMRGTRVRNDLQTAEFSQVEDNINFTRSIRATFSVRFGKLEPNKARKVRAVSAYDN